VLGIFEFIYEMWPRLFYHLQITVSEIIIAVASGALLSLLCMLVMHFSPLLKRCIESSLVLLQTIPLFILSPLLILWLGFSQIAVIAPTALMLVFPLTIAMYKGANATPKEYIEYYSCLGYSKLTLLLHVRLPFALPALFSGMRVAASTATIGALASEWAGGQAGLGVFIQEMRRNYDIYGVVTGILCTIMVSACMYGVIIWFEKLFSKRYAFSRAR